MHGVYIFMYVLIKKKKHSIVLPYKMATNQIREQLASELMNAADRFLVGGEHTCSTIIRARSYMF
jgi:hypothetical protein